MVHGRQFVIRCRIPGSGQFGKDLLDLLPLFGIYPAENDVTRKVQVVAAEGIRCRKTFVAHKQAQISPDQPPFQGRAIRIQTHLCL
jgi:hypothetical protein